MKTDNKPQPHRQVVNYLGFSFAIFVIILLLVCARLYPSVSNASVFYLPLAAASIGAVVMCWKVIKHMQQENQALNREIIKREKLQKELLENKDRYLAVFDNNPLPLLIFDHHTLNILDVNKAAVEEYGYSLAEFKQLSIPDIKPEQERLKLMNMLKSLDPDEVVTTYDSRHMRKDGSIFEVVVKTHALPLNNNMQPLMAVVMNTQEQTQALEKLKQREEQLREVSSSIPGAVFQFHVDQEGKFNFPFMSQGVLEIYGITQQELYQDPYIIFEQIHPEDKEIVFRSIEDSVKSVTPWNIESRLWNPLQNKWKWVRGHSLPTVKEDGTLLYNGTLIDITLQKEAQESVVRNEANLQALLNSSPQSIFLLDENLCIVSFNKVAAQDVKRFLLQELKEGQSILNFIEADQQAELIQDHALAMQGKEVVFETGCSNSWHEIALRPAVSKDNKVLAVALSIHNITEQRNAVEAIKRSEAQLKRAQELANIGSWEYNVEKKSLSVSKSLLKIYEMEVDHESLTFNSFLKYFYPEDADFVQQKLQNALAAKVDVTFEHRTLTKNENIKYLYSVAEIICNAEGAPIRISGASQDITELKYKEQEATAAKVRFQTTLENIPEVIFSSDAQFNLQYISPQISELTGYHEKDLVGDAKLWAKVVHPDDLSHVRNHILPAILDGKKVQHETRLVTKEGVIKWFMFRQSPLYDSKGNIVRVDSSAADITERKVAEGRRALLTEQLQNQNEHLQQFAYIVSHHLRSPIANILGLTNIFKRDEHLSEFNERVLHNLNRSAQLLDATIRDMNDILTIRGQITNTFEVLHFQEILANIVDGLSQDIYSKNAVITSNFDEAPTVNAIRSFVNSILYNLIINAIKFSSPERQLRINISTSIKNSYTCLTVKDNGLGIDLDKQKRKIFGLYKKFHPHIEGKGLGLHLVKTQAELLGGKVKVESQVNVGTVFKVFFKNSVVDEHIKNSFTDR
ncbi:PAS domain S-box protein [Pontibacter sp. MBLB2868]|uniref:PAS domain-containing sensor histidine kinase n=1 Tax=Pontibacter sp. MBLB2868 TaxID=3451555 RepID=UPI003F754D40